MKVAEFQRRGALHFHCVLRLDGISEHGEIEAPPAGFGHELLIDAALAAARHVSVPTTHNRVNPMGRPGRRPRARRALVAAATAGYIAKYATKSTETVGGLLYRLEASDIDRLKVRPHVRRYVETAWEPGRERDLQPQRLRRWAHQLGPRGHCFTKSRPLLDDVYRAAPGPP